MRIALIGLIVSLCGCSSYVTPGRGADLAAFGVSEAERVANTDGAVRASLERKPLATFPTAIAVARVQANGYQSRTASAFGGGRYCVVTTRDVETDEQFERLAKLPQVRGLAPMSRLLLPQMLNSDVELRQAAAQLRADLLLVYTLDTTFTVDETGAPLTVFSLGLFPNRTARVICTASALLMDTRNGYIYGVTEASEKTDQLASSWTSEEAVEQSRRRVETKAFEKLVTQLETTWRGVVNEYAGAKG